MALSVIDEGVRLGGPSGESAALPKRFWLFYGVFWGALALALSLASLQRYLRDGGSHPWEPFLWEYSSAGIVSLLMLGIYAFDSRLAARNLALVRYLAWHALGFLAFTGLHIAGMYGLRFLVYSTLGMAYEPGSGVFVFGYEAAKDLVSYVSLTAIGAGWRLYMREHYRRLELARLQAALAEARLSLLSAQLKPHFLFNTLNLISATMHDDVERADQLLIRLADLLRATLALGERKLHPLAMELELLEQYLALMLARYADRVSLVRAIDENALDALVPCLLLQPLVENSFRHSIEPAMTPARLFLSVEKIGNHVLVTIADDVGHLKSDARTGAVGLSNCRARLAQVFGEAASLELRPLTPSGVECRIAFPYRTQAQEP